MAAHTHKPEPTGFIGKHPALVSTIFAIAVAAAFLFLLINGAGEHHDAGGHGAPAGEHGAAPTHH